MYTINLYEYQFQSKENIQPSIDQLISQSSLLDYKVSTNTMRLNPYLNIIYLFITNETQSIVIKFFTNFKTDIIEKLQVEIIEKTYHSSKHELTETKNNFSQLLTFTSTQL